MKFDLNAIKKTLFGTAVLVASFSFTTVFADVMSDDSMANGKCSPMDLTVFEDKDEKQAYQMNGFSRGDMKYLYSYKYDPRTEVTINGRASKVLRVQYPDDDCYLVAIVKSDQGDFLVNLGPVWYADENNLIVVEGDNISIKGSKIKTNGRYIIIASELKKDDKSLTLRNQNGTAQWGTPKAQKRVAKRPIEKPSSTESTTTTTTTKKQPKDSNY